MNSEGLEGVRGFNECIGQELDAIHYVSFST